MDVEKTLSKNILAPLDVDEVLYAMKYAEKDRDYYKEKPEKLVSFLTFLSNELNK